MSRWFRHYAGLARDEKLVRVAIQSGQTVERVVWVWIALLESASERNDEGTFDCCAAEMAYTLRCQKEEIDGILKCLNDIGRTDGNKIAKWDVRQYKGDSSTERVKKYRAARKEAGLVAQWQPSKAFRQKIYDRDGNACVYCGSDEDLTLDHKVPEMHGGDHSEENLHTACRKCNAQKRDLTHDEYVARNGVTVSVTPHSQRTETERLGPNGPCASDDAPAPANDDVLKPEHVVEAWNDTAQRIGLPKVINLNDPRRKRLRTMIKQHPPDDFARALDALERSPLCRGEKTDWRADFDFFLQTKSFTKLLEGAYG